MRGSQTGGHMHVAAIATRMERPPWTASCNQMAADNARKIVYNFDRMIRRVDAEMHRRVPPLDTAKVGPLGCMILQQLERIEPAPIQKLVSTMGRDPSQMTRILKSLERKGVIRRQPDPCDGRVSLLSLTESGRHFVTQVDAVHASILRELMSDLSDEEKTQLADLLERLE